MDKNTILDYVTETPGNSNRAVLSSMLDSFIEDGNSLPEVTAVDNGKVLTVVEGKWDKAEGGKIEPLIVNFDYIDDEHGYSVFNKTLREVHEAFIRGQIVLVDFEPEYESVSRNEVCLVDISSGFIKFYDHSTDTNAFLYADSLDGYLHSQGED